MRAVVFGASGYGGAELVRIIEGHQELELCGVSGASNVGLTLGEIYPHLWGTKSSDLVLQDTQAIINEINRSQIDVAFLALPNNTAVHIVPQIIDKVRLVVDLSADFRLKDIALYEQYYGFTHPHPELLEAAAYGLCELNRSEIISASLIASPGCYVTAATLSLFPLIDQNIVSSQSIVVNGISGISGAGRGLKLGNLFGEVDSNIYAYSLEGHRHSPEIEQNLGATILFVPHVAPMTRGILTTCYADLTPSAYEFLGGNTMNSRTKNPSGVGYGVTSCVEEFYARDEFVDVLPSHMSPRTKDTIGTNRAVLSYSFDEKTSKVIAIAALDNMVKGAAGQAMQAANLALGFPEGQGLSKIGVYP